MGAGRGGDNPLFLVLSNANFTHYCENRRDTTDICEATDELTCLCVSRYFVNMNYGSNTCSFKWNVQTQFNPLNTELNPICQYYK